MIDVQDRNTRHKSIKKVLLCPTKFDKLERVEKVLVD